MPFSPAIYFLLSTARFITLKSYKDKSYKIQHSLLLPLLVVSNSRESSSNSSARQGFSQWHLVSLPSPLGLPSRPWVTRTAGQPLNPPCLDPGPLHKLLPLPNGPGYSFVPFTYQLELVFFRKPSWIFPSWFHCPSMKSHSLLGKPQVYCLSGCI